MNGARVSRGMYLWLARWGKVKEATLPLVFPIPSGNLGNRTAGLMAKRMGLPVLRFVAATNANDVVPEYLNTGEFRPRASQRTISNAMDVGNPSNFARMLDLYEHDLNALRTDVWGAGFSDADTEQTMRVTKEHYGYLADPHTAVGLLGLRIFQRQKKIPCRGVVLSTAHPAKFADIVATA